MNEVVIYKTPDKRTEIEVRFDTDTVWLNQYQLAELFGTDRSSISKHLNNIFKIKELTRKQTCANFAQVQKEGAKTVRRHVLHYNLDAIISVGYRVNSKKGVQFRQWAIERLKEHLIHGYTINRKRLEQLQKVVEVIERTGKTESLQLSDVKGLLDILSHYTKSFVLLNQYDSSILKTDLLNENITYEIQYEEAKAAVRELKTQLIAKKQATPIFGNEKDEGFKSSLRSIVQTFDGQYLYPSIEEQAAHLLYFIIKNHSFSDGNKRIGAFLFVWFLEKNKHRFKQNGEVKINDNGLVALALLVAQSDPADKELMIRLIINLINNH